MGTIQVLDEHLANMIAAGEVVERPASVVKELVENAIDASATTIEIHVEEGGLEMIRIVDNGKGMDREDCQLAFERHATSKISNARDLFRIRTLGFRGEALPSIAAVSRMELTSSTSSSEVGTQLLIEGGQLGTISDKAAVKGTEVCVRSLFFNTPARLKYMKSIATEVGHISDYVNRLALTHPSISFLLTHNGKTLLQTSGDGKLLHVMAAIYGVQVAKLLLPIAGETLDYKWSGFLSKTEVTRANRSYLSTLVNGRYVRSYSINNAIMRGYHTLLPIGRYPIVALQIEMDPSLVDVNVHPAKLEARFSKEDELCSAIEQSVKETLRQGLGIVRPMATQPKAKVVTQVVQPQFDLQISKPETPQSPLLAASPRLQEWMAKQETTSKQVDVVPHIALSLESGTVKESAVNYEKLEFAKVEAIPHEIVQATMLDQTDTRESFQPYETKIPEQLDIAQAPSLAPHSTNEISGEDNSATAGTDQSQPLLEATNEHETDSPVPVMYPVGQVHGTYIVAQNDEGMYLIDQHAAQERIFYEYFMDKLAEEGISSQIMLFPHTVEYTAAEASKLEKRLSLLQSFGLEIEAFGGRTFIVRAHPHWFPEGAELEVIEELIQFVLETGENAQANVVLMREKAAIMMSCKASIKANRFLTHAEMESLLNQLRKTSSPYTCPHGRPIVIHFTGYDLEKMFKRVT
ncbi:DNA mismatch repair endonuclease MutL [Brevibacillus porteri]|uniref:DNA mismatch repair protein MutL n=1 Tax=Brevibacillus porteri TaxID=2126350 RepID=A0ABX5FS71_9BACL|nr:DNA mismatch repair endonuclease MutL [Brevibacillus porteri]MED1801863.1 DNA mismatch repair endonuclease MutL [Brevibacillus porteri]MED2134996.1 DNA mismatch repair endonuclease MutL [Brevibacillus porteri]MED2745516.1 DNA mismatch repair endonuclease MutL [Brevibacillus porteri]MED2815739.1 DNA mismatch repair endonuclease MutL [Brevibacillus porteri]MED2897576.1 DNA mismatch repair endonuclease MutL [Brevibacillus porteri]